MKRRSFFTAVMGFLVAPFVAARRRKITHRPLRVFIKGPWPRDPELEKVIEAMRQKDMRRMAEHMERKLWG